MEVILLERIERLGQMGDVVKVKAGYARNYLLPQKKALRATSENLKVFESQRVELEAQNLKRKQEADAVATKMDGTKLVMIRQAGESGQLYGSVTARDIAAALEESGFHVNRNQVQLPQPIKILGLHEARVALHPEVSVDVVLNVALSEEEAATQEARGGSAAQLAEQAANAEKQAPAPAPEPEVEASAPESSEDGENPAEEAPEETE